MSFIPKWQAKGPDLVHRVFEADLDLEPQPVEANDLADVQAKIGHYENARPPRGVNDDYEAHGFPTGFHSKSTTRTQRVTSRSP
jgi:hypothetical protein